MRRRLTVAVVLAAVGCAAAAEPAAAQLPACSPERNGQIIQRRITDQAPRTSDLLYATHRLGFDVLADIDSDEQPDGYRYQVGNGDGGAARLAPGPGVVSSNVFLGRAAGPVSPRATWTVYRRTFTTPPAAFCTGSQLVPFTLQKPKRLGLGARRRLSDITGNEPRFVVNVGGPGQDLRPLTVRIRRGRGGRRRTLFTVPLADAAAATSGESSPTGLRRFRFKKSFNRMAVTSASRDSLRESSGVVTIGVKLPKVRRGRRLRRDFTLELSRGSRTLLRLRTVIRCKGAGRRPALQICKTPVYRVTRPSR